MNPTAKRSPAAWSLILAFGLVYLSWGTTYLAIQKGVEAFPPALFGGVRVASAGLLLLAYLALRGQRLRLPWQTFAWVALVGVLMFVGGNGLLTFGEKYVPSGISSVLAATTPIWMALLELLWPWGERLTARGWTGLFAGLAGVVLLLLPRLQEPGGLQEDWGPLLILGSAFSWALGSFVLRHRGLRAPHLVTAAYQMLIGGGTLAIIGLFAGEAGRIEASQFTPTTVYAFFHLLIVGSLIGFVAYNWLVGHTTAAMAGTYAYVNPLVAILVGWLFNSEPITAWLVAGMLVILGGVALVRGGGTRRPARKPNVPTAVQQSFPAERCRSASQTVLQ